MQSVKPGLIQSARTERVNSVNEINPGDETKFRLMIREFIRSCIAVNPELSHQSMLASSTPLQSGLSTPTSTGSGYSTTSSSSEDSKKKIYKYMITNVLKQNFANALQQRFNCDPIRSSSDNLFGFIKKQKSYVDLTEKSKFVIVLIKGSLTKHAVDKLLDQLPDDSPQGGSSRRSSGSSQAAEGANRLSPINSPSQEQLEQSLLYFQAVEKLLETLVDFNKDQLSLPKEGTLTTLISEMAINICSKGFFNPTQLNDGTQEEFANEFITLLKSDKLQFQSTHQQDSVVLGNMLSQATEHPGSSDSGLIGNVSSSNDVPISVSNSDNVPHRPVSPPPKRTTEPSGCFFRWLFFKDCFGGSTPKDFNPITGGTFYHELPD